MLLDRAGRLPTALQILILDDGNTETESLCECFAQMRQVTEIQVVSHLANAMAYLYASDKDYGRPCPDLILIDYCVAGSGGRVLSSLKGDPDLRVIPVIVLCPSEAIEDVKAIYDRHANCCIVRPRCTQDLTNSLTAALAFWVDTALTVPRASRVV